MIGRFAAVVVVCTGVTAAADTSRVVRGTGTARFETFAADGAQQGAAADLAARRAELGADELRPEALITEMAGGGYAALDAQPHPVASQPAAQR